MHDLTSHDNFSMFGALPTKVSFADLIGSLVEGRLVLLLLLLLRLLELGIHTHRLRNPPEK